MDIRLHKEFVKPFPISVKNYVFQMNKNIQPNQFTKILPSASNHFRGKLPQLVKNNKQVFTNETLIKSKLQIGTRNYSLEKCNFKKHQYSMDDNANNFFYSNKYNSAKEENNNISNTAKSIHLDFSNLSINTSKQDINYLKKMKEGPANLHVKRSITEGYNNCSSVPRGRRYQLFNLELVMKCQLKYRPKGALIHEIKPRYKNTINTNYRNKLYEKLHTKYNSIVENKKGIQNFKCRNNPAINNIKSFDVTFGRTQFIDN